MKRILDDTTVRVALGLGAAALAVAGLRRLVNRSLFRDKVVVITGGSRGLGLELARQWAREGARVAICARTLPDIALALDELRAGGHEAIGFVCDVTSQDDVDNFINGVLRHWRRIDVLVNNAGIIQVGPLACMTLDDYHRAMATHLWGPLYAIRAVVPYMQAQGGGRIVNIASIGGEIAVPHMLPYSASKFALVGLSQGLHAELADSGINVTTVCPGLMRTGSPRNALFKGRHREEYAWFSISGSQPGLSISSSAAAKQIVRACRLGKAHLNVGLTSKVARRIQGLAPGITAQVMGLVNRALPSSGGIGQRSTTGKHSYSAWSPSRLTWLNERAARRNNEMR